MGLQNLVVPEAKNERREAPVATDTPRGDGVSKLPTKGDVSFFELAYLED